ncbi:hypothetical protein CPT_Machias_184 [Staphylococcus phage Machias]|nr:hypothetical protein CPT_Machias_184 [Staphylococcus phage Machias]WPH64284.1 hypothetical protein [Staphylococcus phage vB_StaM_PB50]
MTLEEIIKKEENYKKENIYQDNGKRNKEKCMNLNDFILNEVLYTPKI